MTSWKGACTAILRLIALGVVGMQTGCLTLAAYSMAQEERRSEAFRDLDTDAHAWTLADGGSVSGRLAVVAEYKNIYGTVRAVPARTLTCAGHKVSLIPDTEQMRWRVQRMSRLRIIDRGDWIAPAIWVDDWPTSWTPYIRQTPCGADGTFTFDSVAQGPYLLISEITSMEPEYSGSGGLILKPVKVVPGEFMDVTMRSGFVDGALVPR